MTFPKKDRDWSFPISDLDKKIDECFPPMSGGKFHLALGDVMREWSFLSMTWDRLQNEYQDFSECQEIFQNLEKIKLSPKEISQYNRKFMRSSKLIHLDNEDFLIHAEILLDRVTFLTTFFEKRLVKKTGRHPKTKSFKAFRKWFTDPANASVISDTELAKYLSNNTDWFEKLEETRDDLIVHRKRSYYIDVMDQEGKVGKAKARFDYVKNIVDWSDTKKMPDLNFLMDAISEFLRFFDKHFSQMCAHCLKDSKNLLR